jgi:hypothetical protein
MMGEEPDPIDVCRHYYDTVNANIELFLKYKFKYMEFQLETAEEDFRAFWNRIEATGEVSTAVCEWQRQYNAPTPGKDRSRRWSTLVGG